MPQERLVSTQMLEARLRAYDVELGPKIVQLLEGYHNREVSPRGVRLTRLERLWWNRAALFLWDA